MPKPPAVQEATTQTRISPASPTSLSRYNSHDTTSPPTMSGRMRSSLSARRPKARSPCRRLSWHKHSSSYQQQQQPWSSKRLCVLFFVLQLQQHAILPDYVCTNLHTYRYGVVCGSIINKITSTCALVCSMFGVHCLQQTQSILKQRDKIRHIHRHICTCERTK